MKLRILLTFVLLFFILFTSPLVVLKDIQRIQNPPVDPAAVNASHLSDDPREIEKHVKEKIQYEYDFSTYDVFWYIPTVEEIQEKNKGDCKGRAILLASILKSKNIPHELHVATFHWWVSYPTNKPTVYEDKSSSVKKGKEWHLPDISNTLEKMWDVRDQYYEMLWVAMPLYKKIILFAGILLIWVLRVDRLISAD